VQDKKVIKIDHNRY